jgi:hypothetical protein
MPEHAITDTDGDAPAAPLTCWSPVSRAAGAALWTLTRVGAPVLLARVFIVFEPPTGPALPVLAFIAALLGLLLAERLLREAQRGVAWLEGGALRIDARGRAFELSLASIDGVRGWRVPLPAPGLTLRTAGGPRLRLGLDDPDPLLRALTGAGVAAAASAARDPSVAHARARAHWRRGRRIRPDWLRAALRYAVWSLIPTCAFVYTHQWIAFGGTWGEWQLYGFRSWAITFARFWLACLVLAAIYGGTSRALASLACWLATRVAPSHAARARRVAEWGDALVYYAGIPALTALRYLP